MQSQTRNSQQRWPVYVVLVFVAVFSIMLVGMLVTLDGEPENAALELTADTYAARVSALLDGANPENGAALLERSGCMNCHGGGELAPPFTELPAVAASRRPPLTAAAYVYEAILDPAAYLVTGYNPIMPRDFRARLSDDELGDIIAYLLTNGVG